MNGSVNRPPFYMVGKTGNIIFVVTPELKRAVADIARENRVGVSAFISSLLADKALE